MGTSRRQFFQVTAGGLVAASGLAGRVRPVAAQGPTVKIGSAVLGDYSMVAPILVALEKGFFRAQGVTVEFQPLRGGPDLVKAVVAGQIQIGTTGATDVPVFRATGVPIRFIASGVDGNHFTLNVAPTIAKLADLKGKSIGVTRVGATTWVFAMMLAKQQGWTPEKDLTVVGLGGLDAQLAALARGEIAAFVWGDGGAVTELQGKSKILLRLDTVTPKWISQAYYATDDYIKGNKDAIQRTLKALFQGVALHAREHQGGGGDRHQDPPVVRGGDPPGPPGLGAAALEGRDAERRRHRDDADDAPRVQGPGQARPDGRPLHDGVHPGPAVARSCSAQRRTRMEPYELKAGTGVPITSAHAAERVSAFLRRVYGWMAAGLAITALVAFVVVGSPAILQAVFGNRLVFYGLIIAQLGLVFFLSGRAQSLAPSTAALIFALYSALTGVTLSVVLLAYTGESVATTFVVTASMFAALAAFGTMTSRSLAGVGQFFFMGLIGLVLASVLGMFWHSDALQFLISVVGVLVFTGLTAYDAQRLRQMALAVPEGQAGSVAIAGALSLYLNFINLFLFMLRFTGGRRS